MYQCIFDDAVSSTCPLIMFIFHSGSEEEEVEEVQET